MVWPSCKDPKISVRIHSHRGSFATVFLTALMMGMGSVSIIRSEDDVAPKRNAMIVIGAAGEESYAEIFRAAAMQWVEACHANEIEVILVDGAGSEENQESDRERVLGWIESEPATERWLVLIGHGTSDRDASNFNLRGRDLSDEDLAKSLGKQEGSRWLIVHGGSSSGPWINALSGPNRVVVTATKSGAEQNYARFGEYLSLAINDPDSDLDHDHQISVLEAFLAASKRVTQFYSNEDRIPSEQALLDDNNDKKGTPAVFYRGVRPVKSPAEGLKPDGLLASRIQIASLKKQMALTFAQQSEIEHLEEQLEVLRARKQLLEESAYYGELESLMMEVIRVRAIDSSGIDPFGSEP